MKQYLYGKNAVHESVKAKSRKIFKILVHQSLSTDEVKIWKQKAAEIRVNLEVIKDFKSVLPSESVFHQGVVAEVGPYVYQDESTWFEGEAPKLVIACDGLQDPQNLGAIARVAWAMGATGLLLPKNRSVEVTPAVVKASAGAVEHLPIAQVTNMSRSLDLFKEHGYWVYGAIPHGGELSHNWKPPTRTLLVVGSEGDGIRQLVSRHCDAMVSLPMRPDWDSLNVSMATGLFIYQWRLQYPHAN
jgi:23S rRNA (guanosine2251-2'-O)-methyltransferase